MTHAGSLWEGHTRADVAGKRMVMHVAAGVGPSLCLRVIVQGTWAPPPPPNHGVEIQSEICRTSPPLRAKGG